jgi:hypothetical protein
VLAEASDAASARILAVETGTAVRVFELERGSNGAFVEDAEIPPP